jgi:hypothetical protein
MVVKSPRNQDNRKETGKEEDQDWGKHQRKEAHHQHHDVWMLTGLAKIRGSGVRRNHTLP